MSDVYGLKVTQVEQVCFFELTWGRGRRLTAKLPYPDLVEAFYQNWQRIYLNYYQSALRLGPLPSSALPSNPSPSNSPTSNPPTSNPSTSNLRGKAVASGQITAQPDWHGQLVQAEAKLLYEFHQWLRQAALFDIRSELGRKAAEPSAARLASEGSSGGLDLLITCDPLDLGRWPWEEWEINAEYGSHRPVRIARLPVNVHEAITSVSRPHAAARVLVILGDDTGLDFEAELAAIASLNRLAQIQVIGWQPGVDPTALKQRICNTIQASPGWDMLLFFGHSNEANAVGGQVAIAPQTTLSLRELDPYLRQAKQQGLKFALFNSCKGLDIANALINIGLNQVAVMREPIHNRVAQVFLIQFMQSLASFDDVHTALQKASQFLRSKSNLTYPSAHLVPSLFRHSDAVLFRLQPVGWRAWLDDLLPHTRWQTATLCLIAGLSLFNPTAEALSARRLRVQAAYRNLTGQVPTASPPVLLVEIDDLSIREGFPNGVPNPMDRAYLASILDRLSALQARVVGIDYLLDRAQAQNDRRFAEAVSESVAEGSTLVFGSVLQAEGEIGIREELASLNWVMQGYTNTPVGYLRALPMGRSCVESCPFSYLLAIAQTTDQFAAQSTPQLQAAIAPDLESQTDYRRTLFTTVQNQIQSRNRESELAALYQLRLSPWASISRWWNQRWLHPRLDYSLPPNTIYRKLSAHDLLQTPQTQLVEQFDWPNQVVIVASGAYDEAGTGMARDYIDTPSAIAYWQAQTGSLTGRDHRFTGGQTNAYAVHHFLRAHYLTPIPDLWLVGAGVLAGAGIVLLCQRQQPTYRSRQLALLVASLGYGWFSLQLGVTGQLLLPWLLPVATVWVFCLPTVLPAAAKE
ncbi:CHASE2 domain-containing protein [cf. Phormidesmis sp. LEGE 11477]|uniref:CHASE2 domain-containing protein n=1 Tax=cf. Phormidesmis sp. LEGE 11477 TaxID=1828680 RepID=UPI00187F6E86|nr:CHASE2 domain-containing protein [cf. Phormidesmis sp. LEGE 11477]MBE9059756.1 CHASE2 domain-containing protein [cf. Phormidesmis sp. LEGE 11477]